MPLEINGVKMQEFILQMDFYCSHNAGTVQLPHCSAGQLAWDWVLGTPLQSISIHHFLPLSEDRPQMMHRFCLSG